MNFLLSLGEDAQPTAARESLRVPAAKERSAWAVAARPFARVGPITFINRSSIVVDIYRIDNGGARKCKKSRLAIGEGWRTSTFAMHP